MMIFDSSIIGPWICSAAGAQWKDEPCIGWKNEQGLVIGTMYDQYTRNSISAHIRCDYPGKVPPLFYAVAFDYPFNQLKVKRITLIINETNLKANRIAQHLGFKRETKLRDYFREGDAIIYAMFRDDCRFLEERYGKKLSARYA